MKRKQCKPEPASERTFSFEYVLENRTSLLAELGQTQTLIRDCVRGVARGYSTGMYLYGPPGTAKTHTVKSVLDNEIKETYCYQRGHVTPLGLFRLLGKHRDEVLVLDDISSLFRSETALQIFLAACEPPAKHSRPVAYTWRDCHEDFDFSGGIICISNLELHDDQLLSAFQSRVHVFKYAPTDEQLAAMMLDIASKGWPIGEGPTIKPHEAMSVVKHVIQEIIRIGSRFDLRLLVNKALPAYQQWLDNETDLHWRELATSSVEQSMSSPLAPPHTTSLSREERKQHDRVVLREIVKSVPDREGQVRAWREQTGKSEASFYRRLAELPP